MTLFIGSYLKIVTLSDVEIKLNSFELSFLYRKTPSAIFEFYVMSNTGSQAVLKAKKTKNRMPLPTSNNIVQ